MPTAKERSKERRWIVLSIDGRYGTIGRASDLSEDEVFEAKASFQAQGVYGGEKVGH